MERSKHGVLGEKTLFLFFPGLGGSIAGDSSMVGSMGLASNRFSDGSSLEYMDRSGMGGSSS